MSTTEDQIKKMYSTQLDAKMEQLKQEYTQADEAYAAEKEKSQKTTDANLTRTAVEAQKAAVSNAELHDAYGLSSGTRAQARLAQENQLQSDLTALRVQQQELDADVERQRTLLSQQYQSAIQEAQAENDLALAEALYAEAKAQEEALLAQQEAQNKYALEYAKWAAENGDNSALLKFYASQGVTLTDEDLASITEGEKGPTTVTIPTMVTNTQQSQQKAAGADNWSRFQSLMHAPMTVDANTAANNGNVSENGIMRLQTALGIKPDGVWGAEEQAAAKEKWGVTSADEAFAIVMSGSRDYEFAKMTALIESAKAEQAAQTQTAEPSNEAVNSVYSSISGSNFTGTTYASGISYMRTNGVQSSTMQGLMTAEEWSSAKSGGNVLAAAYDTYSEYLNSFVQYAIAMKGEQRSGSEITTSVRGASAQ